MRTGGPGMQRGIRAVAVSLLVLGSIGLAPVARATTPDSTLVAPSTFGTVDFGDRVPYRLVGSTCTADSVRVDVAATSVVQGAASQPVADPQAPGTCVGFAAVPSEAAVRTTGWSEGD